MEFKHLLTCQILPSSSHCASFRPNDPLTCSLRNTKQPMLFAATFSKSSAQNEQQQFRLVNVLDLSRCNFYTPFLEILEDDYKERGEKRHQNVIANCLHYKTVACLVASILLRIKCQYLTHFYRGQFNFIKHCFTIGLFVTQYLRTKEVRNYQILIHSKNHNTRK